MTQDRDKYQNYGKNKRFWLNKAKLALSLLSSLALTTIFLFLYHPNPLHLLPKQTSLHQKPAFQIPPPQKEDENCDLFKGHWVPELKGIPYTNSSCATIPESKNCFKNGRKDTDFLNWRWKPDGCELPRFDAKAFLGIFRGKTLAFIGDSVARNHMDSLLCLLSQKETPIDVYKDSEDRFRTWYFPNHDFTLMILWSKFLVMGDEIEINGTLSSVNLHLDKVDNNWAKHLPTIDFAVISAGHWFFRHMYLHKGEKQVGCVFCHEQNVSDLGLGFALRMAFRAAFKHINKCRNCKGSLTLLRTFSPAHFENGVWNTGGYCNRTSPMEEKEINLNNFDWGLRGIQVDEIERARKEAKKPGRKWRFGVLDVTRAMFMRPDGHPGDNWGNKWMKGYNDCVHWCLPGPIDAWNDLLMSVIVKEAGLVF